MTKVHITLEGNLGAGKSTVLANVYERFGVDRGLAYAWEPLDEWNTSGFLADMYSGKIPHGEFQCMVLCSMFDRTFNGLTGSEVLLQERSVDAAFEVFTKCNLDPAGSSFRVVAYCFGKLKALLGNTFGARTHRIYLRIPPKVACSRVAERSRSSETAVSLEYLSSIHDGYERWLSSEEGSGEDVTVVDATRNVRDVTRDVVRVILGILDEDKHPKQLFAPQ